MFVPRHCGHRFKNITGQAAKTLFLFTPAGPEDLFVEGGDDPRPGAPHPDVITVRWRGQDLSSVSAIVVGTACTQLPA